MHLFFRLLGEYSLSLPDSQVSDWSVNISTFQNGEAQKCSFRQLSGTWRLQLLQGLITSFTFVFLSGKKKKEQGDCGEKQLPETTTKINGKDRNEFRSLKTQPSTLVLWEHCLSVANHELMSLCWALVAVSQSVLHEATVQWSMQLINGAGLSTELQIKSEENRVHWAPVTNFRFSNSALKTSFFGN